MLNIENLKVIELEENEENYVVHAQSISPNRTCAECGSTNTVETVPQKPPASFPMVNAMYGKHCSSERASGRTFRALLEVMGVASESPENSLTVFVSMNETCQNREFHLLAGMLQQGVKGMVCDTATRTIILPGNRLIRVTTKKQSSKITEPCHVVYDHTVQGN